MPTARSIEQSSVIAKPRDDVFRALTDPDVLNTWWTTSATSDARTGGAFVYQWAFTDPANDHRQEGAYLQVTDGESVSYPWSAGPATSTIVTFTLADADDSATELRLVHTGFSSDAETDAVYERHVAGWTGFIANLKSVLGGGSDQRAAMGLKVPASR